MSSSLFSDVSSIRFCAYGLMLSFLIHVDLNFVYGAKMDLFVFFYMLISSYASTIVGDVFFFQLYNFGYFVKNQMSICV